MNEVYLLLGSNEGDREGWLQMAIDQLAAGGGEIVNKSSVYETAAWGITEQPNFLNRVVLLQTVKTPVQLLSEIHEIEKNAGRQREVKWGQRTLDIDILLYNSDVLDLPGLTIPHPFLHLRRFTLVPLAEIAAQYMHPRLHKTILELLVVCPDPLEVHMI